MISANMILEHVALAYGLTVESLTSRDRHAFIATPRHIAMWLIRRRLHFSYPQIGRLFHRDHSTVMHGIAKISGYITTDRKFGLEIDALEGRLGWPGLHVTRADQLEGIEEVAS